MEQFSKKILIVDDEKHLRNIVKFSLNKNGFECIEADNGEAGLDLLEKNSDDIFLVIVDILMPVMNGLDFLKIAKPKYKDIEYIILTAASSASTVIDALKYGATTYCSKPLNLDEMKFIAEKSKEIYCIRQQNRELINRIKENQNVEVENFEYKLIAEELRREIIVKENLIIRLTSFIRENSKNLPVPEDIKLLIGEQ
ncbi:MAG TPA: response regulator [bacterium]|nr:response regulator [bacterium]HPN30858.1 response regulator [bacterium]